MTDTDFRSAYLEMAEAKLIEIQANVAIVDLKVKHEIANGHGCAIEQIQLTNHQVEHFMSAARQKLHDLNLADDANWETARNAFNNAWEDVAESIRKAVARFS